MYPCICHQKVTNFDFVLSLGTELFTVRAFPRRLFNIQALDGVSM